MALRQTRFFVSSVITHVCSACSWRGKVDSAATMHRRNLNTVFSFMMTLLSIMIHAHASLFSFSRPDILPQPPDQKYAKGRDASRRTRLSLELKTKCPESFDTLLAPRVALRGGATDNRDIMSKQQRSWAGPPHCVKVWSATDTPRSVRGHARVAYYFAVDHYIEPVQNDGPSGLESHRGAFCSGCSVAESM